MILFGAGALGRDTIKCLKPLGIEPEAVADNNPTRWGDTLLGIPIIPPDQIHPNNHVVITIYNPSTVMRQLNDRAETYPQFARTVFLDQSRMPAPWIYIPKPSEIDWGQVVKATNVIENPELLLEQLAWFDHLDDRKLSPPTPANETYFPDGSLSNEEFLLDCGGYTGDTIEQFSSKVPDFKRIVSCEPMRENLERLKTYSSDKVTVLSCAVGERHGYATFKYDAEASRPSDSGYEVVVIPIDALRVEPTIIKMDIEGSEVSALKGASRTIRKLRPRLAICAYHKLSHLWEIPLTIHEINPEYNIRLRVHAEQCWEQIYYAE
jgi:FkbM family methyltransferase